jgi:hypothetical protein
MIQPVTTARVIVPVRLPRTLARQPMIMHKPTVLGLSEGRPGGASWHVRVASSRVPGPPLRPGPAQAAWSLKPWHHRAESLPGPLRSRYYRDHRDLHGHGGPSTACLSVTPLAHDGVTSATAAAEEAPRRSPSPATPSRCGRPASHAAPPPGAAPCRAAAVPRDAACCVLLVACRECCMQHAAASCADKPVPTSLCRQAAVKPGQSPRGGATATMTGSHSGPTPTPAPARLRLRLRHRLRRREPLLLVPRGTTPTHSPDHSRRLPPAARVGGPAPARAGPPRCCSRWRAGAGAGETPQDAGGVAVGAGLPDCC